MTVLTRWEPFREFSTLQDRINRAFRDSPLERRASPSPPRALPPPSTSTKTSTRSL